MSTKSLKTVAASVAGTVAIIALVLLILIFVGAYNVSAAAGHTALGRWAARTMMRNSVQARADAKAPQFTAAMVKAGAGEYKAMCQQCHGGPGAERAEWAKGLVPQPPELTHAAKEWSPSEVHWILNNGIKMSAMPSFGATHDSETLWKIAAFVEQLPGMTAEQYAAFPAEGHHEGESAESGHHGDASEESGAHSHSH